MARLHLWGNSVSIDIDIALLEVCTQIEGELHTGEWEARMSYNKRPNEEYVAKPHKNNENSTLSIALCMCYDNANSSKKSVCRPFSGICQLFSTKAHNVLRACPTNYFDLSTLVMCAYACDTLSSTTQSIILIILS